MSQLIPIGQREIVTMTSLEIVDFINDLRKEDALNAGAAFPSPGFAKLEHSDFMKKVPEVLDGGAGNFSDTYVHPQNGQTYPCYRFPKREASLMAMSYSYKIQARVWDHMTALEEKLTAKETAVSLRRTGNSLNRFALFDNGLLNRCSNLLRHLRHRRCIS